MNWGIERAREANVPVSVKAGTVGRGLYGKVGFRDVGYERVGDVEGGVVVGIAMILDAEEDAEGGYS